MSRLALILEVWTVTLVATVGTAQSRLPDLDGPLVANLESNAGAISRAEILLELRRGGGPRSSTLEAPLRRLWEADRMGWLAILPWLCERGHVDCREHVDAALQLESQLAPEDRQYYQAALKFLRYEAWFRGLSSAERIDYLRKCVVTPERIDDDGSCSPQQAATRGLRLGLVELDADIDAGLRSGLIRKTPTLAAAMIVAVASQTAERESNLFALVSDAARAELKSALEANKLTHEARPETERLVVQGAVDGLRRLNARGQIGSLRQIVERYRSVTRQSALHSGPASLAAPGGRSVRTGQVFGYGEQVAELVGDLGDRDFERETLGAPTLWDRVQEVESKLVLTRQLDPVATVTIRAGEK